MSVASPPHAAASAPARPLIETQPIRHPDTASTGFMTRRAWWLVVMNWLVPGSAQILAGNRRLGRFGLTMTLIAWTLVVVTALFALLWPQALTALTGQRVALWILLTVAQVLLVGYVVLWIVLTFDTLRLVRLVKAKPLARFGVTLLAIVLLVVSGGAAGFAANLAGITRDTIGSIFGASGAVVPPSDGYYNILLLGADSGEGRDSMRFDSISVVSINADTGATTITGIPRDMPGVPFSEGPMRDRYPDGHVGFADPECGWTSAINQIRVEVEVCSDDGGESLYPDAASQGSAPGVEATKDAAEGVLGIEIPYYVFIDMNGFADLVDALGGVDITVDERLPKGGGPAYRGQPVDDWAIGWIEAGEQHMDGDTAQWYARSRYTTNDWDRMQRQRQLQEAILAQFTPANVLARFQEVAGAGTDLVQTDLPQAMLPAFVDLGAKAKEQPVTTIELTPANGVDPDAPDFDAIHEVIHDSLHPATESPAS